MIAQVNGVLKSAAPFMQLVAWICGIIGAWALACELLPILAQIWRPKGGAQAWLIGGACLAHIAGRA